MKSSSNIYFFFGLGPSLTYSYSQYSTDEIDVNWSDYSKSQYLYSSNSTQWGIGIIGNVGIEYFPSQRYSIRAEFSESVQYQWGSNNASNYYPNSFPLYYNTSGTSYGWLFGGSSVYFGLGICL